MCCNRVTVFSEDWYWVLVGVGGDSSERDREKRVCRETADGVLQQSDCV